MNQQLMENYLQRFKGILNQVKTEVGKLYTKQEELTRIDTNIHLVKDTTTQILNILKSYSNSHPQQQQQQMLTQHIHSLHKIMNIECKIGIWSMLELNDSRIAIGDYNGKLSLFTIDFTNAQWKLSAEHKAHSDSISSLCELQGRNTLISGSYDNTVKVWKLTDNNSLLSLIATLKGHNSFINQVIPLSTTVIASGSFDKTIRLWDINTCKETHSFNEDFSVWSLLRLKSKDVLASSGNGKRISFWNVNALIKEHTMKCCHCDRNGLIELNKHYIAVSGGNSMSIDVIDTHNYKVVKHIECEEYIVQSNNVSSVRCLNNGSFVYCHDGCLCQIEFESCDVVFKVKMEEEFKGTTVVCTANGKYIIANNNKKGISIFTIKYK